MRDYIQTSWFFKACPMRARNIKPGFFENEELADLPPLTRLLYIGLWLLADREGRLENRPRRIKAQIFPYERRPDIPAMLTVLEQVWFRAGLRRRRSILAPSDVLGSPTHPPP